MSECINAGDPVPSPAQKPIHHNIEARTITARLIITSLGGWDRAGGIRDARTGPRRYRPDARETSAGVRG